MDNPAVIDPSMSQSLLNVNIQPGGSAVFKRDGYGLFEALPSASTGPIHGGYHFQQSGGSDVQLWGSDAYLSGSVSDASAVKLATGTIGATWQCADSQGFAYCFSSSHDTPIQTDGTVANTIYFSSAPSGTMATFTPLQLVVAGVSGNTNTLYISAQNNFANFNIGILPSSSFVYPIAAPGSRITHIAYYFGRLFWWKDQSFGYVTFTNQNDPQVTIVSNQIGTLDNSDAFWNSSGFDAGTMFSGSQQANANASPGGIFFRGQDNHFYVYDGYYLTRLSRPITPTVQLSNRRKANSWTQTTATDFSGGSSYATYTDTTTVPGLIQPTNFTDYFNNLGNWNNVSGVWTATNNQAIANATSVSRTAEDYSDVPGQSNINLTSWDLFSSMHFGSTNLGGDQVEVDYVDSGFNGYGILYTLDIAGSLLYAQIIRLTNHIYTAISAQTTISAGLPYNNHTFDLKRTAGGVFSLYVDGSVIASSATDTTYTGVSRADLLYNYQGGANGSFIFNLFSIASASSTYYSAVNNAPNITTWGSFNATTFNFGGTQNFQVRASTGSIAVSASTPSWVNQTNGATVQASTGTYMQMSDTFISTSTAYTGQVPTLNDFTFNWFEGTASDKCYISYFNDAIWFSVSAGTTTSTNNEIFYWDLLNGAWLVYNIPSNGFLIENNTLYFGSPTNNNIYKFGGVSSDNGAPINSYWRSKAFLGNQTSESSSNGTSLTFAATDDLFVQKEFVQSDFILGESSTTLTYTYTLDSSTSTTFNMNSYSATSSLVQRNFLLPVGKIGKYYDFSIGDNSINPKWVFMGHRVKYNPLNWRPVLQ
jgi:hypothetical protein